jgi:hypothetical protein
LDEHAAIGEQVESAERFGVSAGVFRMAISRVRQRYTEALKSIVAHTLQIAATLTRS